MLVADQHGPHSNIPNGAATLRMQPQSPHLDNAEVLTRETGQPVADPMKLIVPMLERFIATDRGFAKARKSAPSFPGANKAGLS